MTLTVTQSITLLAACLKIGEERSTKTTAKDITIVIGNTGAGKSSLVNYLAGCKMKLVKAKEIGVQAIGKLLLVQGPLPHDAIWFGFVQPPALPSASSNRAMQPKL